MKSLDCFLTRNSTAEFYLRPCNRVGQRMLELDGFSFRRKWTRRAYRCFWWAFLPYQNEQFVSSGGNSDAEPGEAGTAIERDQSEDEDTAFPTAWSTARNYSSEWMVSRINRHWVLKLEIPYSLCIVAVFRYHNLIKVFQKRPSLGWWVLWAKLKYDLPKRKRPGVGLYFDCY